MITYFLEQDLVSFGNFLLSPTRKKAYMAQGLPEDKVNEMLLAVNSFDLTTWFNTVVKAGASAEEPVTNAPVDSALIGVPEEIPANEG